MTTPNYNDLMMWTPSPQQIQDSNISKFIKYLHSKDSTLLTKISNSDDLYTWSIKNPDQFWLQFWKFSEIIYHAPWNCVLHNQEDMLNAKWFDGCSLNYAENLLRYDGEDAAIIFWNESKQKITVSRNELIHNVSAIAYYLKKCGITKGDRVAAIMPNIPQTVIAMLAATSIGAIWSSCSPDYGIDGIVDRIGQISPKVLFTIDSYSYSDTIFDCSEKIDAVISKVPSIIETIVMPYISNDIHLSRHHKWQIWDNIISSTPKSTKLDFVPVSFDHPLFIMFSSGTTGTPKCIVHSVGGTLIQHIKEHILHTDLKFNQRMFFYTTCGWMMWNWLVSALASGITLVLYDGSPIGHGPETLWELAQECKVNVFGTSAKYLSALEKREFNAKKSFPLEALHTILSTGSPLLPENYDYVYSNIKHDVKLCSISGGTDIISCFALGNPTKPIYKGELQQRGFAMAVTVLKDNGDIARIDEKGELSCTKPFPSQPIYFWNDDENKTKYKKAYFDKLKNIWCHGDFASLTKHGGVIIYGRSDTTLNPGGIRIGTAEIYRQIENLHQITDSVAVGFNLGGDEQVILFVILANDQILDKNLKDLIKQTIKQGASPHHVPAKIIAVADIPRTISGKISETAVKDVINGIEVKNIGALANPESLDNFRNLKELQ